jgi:hypothetical protein
MAPEETRVRLRQKLEDAFGVEEASYLMDRPPAGWSDLVTNQVLDAKLDVLRSEIRMELAEVKVGLATLSASVDERLRRQTWISTSTLVSGLGLAFAIARFA